MTDAGPPDPRKALDPGPVCAAGLAAGLHAVGVTGPEPFDVTREALERRRTEGLAADMAFTFRNPSRSTDPARTLPTVRAVVAGLRAYPAEIEPPPPGYVVPGRVARYVAGSHYEALGLGLEAVAEHLRGLGWRAVVLFDQNHLVDRAAAHRAGLAWWGKNTNLLVPEAGSWFVVGEVLTDAPLAPTAAEPLADGCGPCRRCLDGCPTGALVAPGELDARRCLAWLLQAPGVFPAEHRVALADRLYGCDDCQEVCPPNRRASPTHPVGPASSRAAWRDVVAMLELDDATLLEQLGTWYVPGREPGHLRRNLLLVVGNAPLPSPLPTRVTAALRRHLASADELVRAAAVWAARRHGRADLLDAVGDDPSVVVRAELAAVVPLRAG